MCAKNPDCLDFIEQKEAAAAVARLRPRFFDQVGHEIMYASSGNKHFFTK